MTVSTTQIRASYSGDGTTVNFPIPFPFYLSTDILVILAGNTLNSGYSVSGGNGSTGTLTMATPPVFGVVLQVILNVPLTQLVNLVDGTEFPSATLNQVNDRAIQAILRLSDVLSRSLHAPDADVSPGMVLPAASARPGLFLSFDGGGNVLLTSAGPGTQNTQATLGPILNPQTAAEIAAGVQPTNYAYPAAPVADARRYCTLVLDGSMDNTSAIRGMWTALATYRGTITIPYGAKFDKGTVYSTIPVGVILLDQSSVNTGQPPGYKNKHCDQVTNNTASDDSFQGIIDGHNPAFRINNTRTAGTSSALGCYHNILFSTGFRWNGDPVDGMQYLTYLSPRAVAPAYLWRNAWLTNTKAQAAILSVQWQASTVFANGALINTADGNVWINNGSSGTSGSTQPTGTGPTLTDGGITWTWLFAWNVGSTLFFFDEDGYGGLTGDTARFGVDGSTRKGPSLNINNSTHDAFIRDDQRSLDFWRCSDASGLQTGMIRSLTYSGALSGATPTLSGDLHTVTNGGATNMTNLVLPGTQARGLVTLYFTNGNTTVKASGFNLKGGVDVTPASGNIMVFFKEPNISGSWTEISRNF